MILHELLREGTGFSPHYEPVSNSDHLPMVLAAMSGLGATDSQLRGFRDTYVTRLHRAPAAPEIEHWQQGIGRLDAYPSVMNWFGDRIDQVGVVSTLAETLPGFLPGLAIDAFHPIIRLGYAVDFDCPEEVAAALACLTIVHHEIPISEAAVDLRQLVSAQTAAGAISFVENRFGPSILELVRNGTYPVGRALDFQTIARISLDLYRSTRNFFALHLVTATQALRCLLQDDSKNPDLEIMANSSMTGALLAAHLVLGSPKILSDALPAPRQLDPEHCYKYVWACVCEYRRYSDADYLSEIALFREQGLVPDWVARDLFDNTD